MNARIAGTTGLVFQYKTIQCFLKFMVMPKHPVQLTIPEPCDQSWNEMLPAPNGRHCSTCASAVIDFSWMNDDELLHFIRTMHVIPCGRFRVDQLDRPLFGTTAARRSNYGVLRKLAASLTLLVGLAISAPAQIGGTRNPKAKGDVSKKVSPSSQSPTLRDSLIVEVSGLVLDQNQEPLIFQHIEMLYDGVPIGAAQTDVNGTFVLKSDQHLPAGELVVVRISTWDWEGETLVTVAKQRIDIRIDACINPARYLDLQRVQIIQGGPMRHSPISVLATGTGSIATQIENRRPLRRLWINLTSFFGRR